MTWTVDGIEFSYRRTMTVTTRPTATLTNYPLNIPIAADSIIGARCRSDMRDLRFTLADGTLLSAHQRTGLVTGGAATGRFFINIPSIISSGDTAMYCYYGVADANAQAIQTAAYNANFKAVWPLDEASGSLADVTANGNTLTAYNTPTYQAAGQLDYGVSLAAASSEYLEMAAAIVTAAPLTIEAWFKPVSITADYVLAQIACKTSASPYNYNYLGAIGATDPSCIWANSRTGVSAQSWSKKGNYTTGWNHAAGAWASATSRIAYLNGVAGTEETTSRVPANLGITSLGVLHYYTTTEIKAAYFNGVLDEVRISNVARAAEWIAYDYTSQSASVLTWGAEETPGGAANRRRRALVAMAA